jgi:hypothetical protein
MEWRRSGEGWDHREGKLPGEFAVVVATVKVSGECVVELQVWLSYTSGSLLYSDAKPLCRLTNEVLSRAEGDREQTRIVTGRRRVAGELPECFTVN